MNKIVILLLFSVFCCCLGYANMEGITWGFRYQSSFWTTVDFFDLGFVRTSQWVAYELLSVLPFAVGWLLVGVVVGREMEVKRSKRRARVYPSLESYEEAVYGEIVSQERVE